MSDLSDPRILKAAVDAQAEIEANAVQEWFYDAPILIGDMLHDHCAFASRAIGKILVSMGNDWGIWADRFDLSDAAKRVLSHWDAQPHRLGFYRTDFVFAAGGSIKLIENTCRFALNGYTSATTSNLIGHRRTPKHAVTNIADDALLPLFDRLAADFDGKSRLVVLTGDDLRNESMFLTRVFAHDPGMVVRIDYRDIDAEIDQLDDALILSELALEELEQLSASTLAYLSKATFINDPRTMFFAHDKAFFALIQDDTFLTSVLGQNDSERFKSYLLPTFVFSANKPAWETARETPQNWILKHRRLGKSQSIYAGPTMDPAAWRKVFETENLSDFILQKWEPQQRLAGQQNQRDISHFVAGTLLGMDLKYLGTGEFRTCIEPISNTGEFRKIAGLRWHQPMTEFPGVWTL